MNYKYQRRQIFGKRLKVPKKILEKVYNCTLSFNEFIEFQLDDKIPTSCLNESDRIIVERFGIEKCKELDWELINKELYESYVNIRNILLSIDPREEDINRALYELLKDRIKPIEYSPKMAEIYHDRLFEIPQMENDKINNTSEIEIVSLKSRFNKGEINLVEIINNWNLFKDKDLSYCLLNDRNNRNNRNNITDSSLKEFMNNYSSLAPLIVDYSNIYTFISTISSINTNEERHSYIKSITDEILNNVSPYDLTNEEYKEIFKYSSIEEILIKYDKYSAPSIIEELKTLPDDYLFNMPIPFSDLLNENVLTFIGFYGLKNIVDFDNECGHFFTRDDCALLHQMYTLYLRYDNNIYDPSRSLATKNAVDENGNSVDRPYTKDEFYEAMRRMIVFGPTDYSYSPPNYKFITGEFRERYPELFISEQAPEELQNLFYTKSITPQVLIDHPKYIKFLEGKDLASCFINLEIRIYGSKNPYGYENFYKFLVDKIDFDIMLRYAIYLEKIYKENKHYIFSYNGDFTPEKFFDELDKLILQNIIEGKIKYDENAPEHFKTSNPTLFLDKNISPEIRKKFYNREFTEKDFEDNPDLFNIFENTNIACAFSEEMAWIISLYSDSKNIKEANRKRFKVIQVYSNITDISLKLSFRDFVEKHVNDLNIEKLDEFYELFSRLEYSNSIELSSFKVPIANLLLETDDPIKNLDKIESIFLRNNLPLCGKMFLCFQVLYPVMSKVSKFNFNNTSRVAPELIDNNMPNIGFHASNDEKRLIIIFNDLLRIAYRSNERSLVEYIDNIEKGNELYLKLQAKKKSFSNLTEEEINVLEIFVSHLEVLYEQTKNGKERKLDLSNLSLEKKLEVLNREFKTNSKYDLKDRIVRSFCYAAGIKSFDELKQLLSDSLKEQRERTDKNLETLEKTNGIFKIEAGDLVRGIGDLIAFSSSIGTGNFSKEHLGVFLGTSESDTTPLDVDLTLVTRTESLYSAIKDTPTGFGFGNIYIIIKKDNPNFYTTRDKEGKLTGEKHDPKKVELFGTATSDGGYQTHWGARTGISLADVDFILFKRRAKIDDRQPYDEYGNVNYLPPSNNEEKEFIDELQAVKFEIAKNGFYIPVIDFSGRLIFTKKEFINLRKKMQGLGYYGETTYEISQELITPEVEEIADELTDAAKENTDDKRNQINDIVKEALNEMGLTIKYKMDGDLSSKSVEFIDTGSTGRDTNIPYDGDFDFYMRLDANIMRNPTALQDFKTRIETKFKNHKITNCFYTNDGDLRIKGLQLQSGETVDVDISFGVKTNKVKYSSDECLKDRLTTIKKLYPDKYKYVVANIIMAKKFFKSEEVNAYKPHRTDQNQGGLGGIGIENWILQNGGSFIQACRSFMNAAVDKRTGEIIPFDQFKSKYQIWDFGENHFSARKGHYLYDNFVENNMNEIGYKKMATAIKEYLKSIELSKSDDKTVKL